MQITLKQTIAAIFAISALTACQDYIPFWDGENYDKDLGHSAAEFPDFNTTKEFKFNINYGKKGSRALINIYTEDPQYMGADGDVYIRDEAEFATFLDESGRFNGKVVLPADTRKVWVYTSRPGLPELKTVEVIGDAIGRVTDDGNVVVFDYSQPGFTPYDELHYNEEIPYYGQTFFDVIGESSKADIEENGGKSYKIWHAATRTDDKYNTRHRMFSITNWLGQRFGRIKETHYFDEKGVQHDVKDTRSKSKPYDTQGLLEDFSNVVNTKHDPDVMGTDDIETIQQFLWNGRTTKPEGLQNRKYYKNLDTEDINIAIPKTYIDGGEVKTVDKAQVWMRFLGEGAYYCDGIGYYVYDTDNPPQSMDDIKAYYVVFPNTSSTAPYDVENNTFKGRTVPFITYKYKDGNIDKWTTDASFGDANTTKFSFVYTQEVYNPSTGKYEEKPGNSGSTDAWNPKYVPFDINQRMQLLYHEFEWVKKDGKDVPVTTKVSKYFPPGKTIGFFLVPFKNEWDWSKTAEPSHETFRMACNMDFFHSNWRINKPQTGYGEGDYNETTGEGVTGTVKDEDGLPICRDGNGNTISKRHFIALNYGNFAVYGVEDGVDDSMGDVLFTIKTDPIGIVVNDDRVTIEKKMVATTTNHRTYAFEDIWPDGGDYDMNDVVIDHHHRMTILRDGDGNTENDWITKIEDDFIPIQPTGSADYEDAFGFQIPLSRWEDESRVKVLKDGKPYYDYIIEYPNGDRITGQEKENDKPFVEDKDDTDKGNENGSTGGENGYTTGNTNGENGDETGDTNGGNGDGTEKKEEDKITIILFQNAKDENVQYSKFTVIRTFSTGFAERNNLHIAATQLEQNNMNVLNPFIISQSNVNMKQDRLEIHLPKHKPTQYGLTLDGGTPPQYYVGKNREGKEFPFAVSVPKSAFSYPWGQHFTDLGTGEGIEIDDPGAYPDFAKWVKAVKENNETNITKYSGWYKYLGKSIDGSDTTASDGN